MATQLNYSLDKYQSFKLWSTIELTFLCTNSSSSLFKVEYVLANSGFMKNSRYPPNIFR